ncbi:hypothetical protein [Auraticoccus monumenti]|uniref:Uncharacterized protein n=1 Tax=Auraticoccus monumenti TaxID=675864 RepID=A0A1G6ZKE6_9ACTN|nr:hypothetical protein [Auraticoccus monumenti]SDE02046.1 hypothetical protein SAMN04489747_2296 [Auraticoccus monumenti]
MAEWPEEASRQARDDFDRLLPMAMRAAHVELASKGEFWPFAVVVDVDGDASRAASELPRERPPAGEVLAELRRSLRASEQPLRAVAVVLDVHEPRLGSDCIEVSLEHLGSPPVVVQRPYTRRRFGGRVAYRPDVTVPGTATIFV